MMTDRLINALRLIFSRDAKFTLDALMREAPDSPRMRLPEVGHIVVHRPMSVFAEQGQYALFGFNRDHQLVAIQYRNLHEAAWSAEAEFDAARPILQKRCQGQWRRGFQWERHDRLELETYTWSLGRFEKVTLGRAQLTLRGQARMITITRHLQQPAAWEATSANLADLFQ